MDLRQLIERLKQLSDIFYDNGIEDIYTNSKIYEVLMSEQFGLQITLKQNASSATAERLFHF